MTFDHNQMTCEEFQSRMPELIGSGEDATTHPHLHTCALCRHLLNDLETIAEAARKLFPTENPPDTLWEKLESAIKQQSKPSCGYQALLPSPAPLNRRSP